jgi:coproporphyrinogen III oxidase
MLQEYKDKFYSHVKELQQVIIKEMQSLDADLVISEDRWNRLDHAGNEGGGGLTCALEGSLFENAGVNTSNVVGQINPDFAKNLSGTGNELWASGISLIIHPVSPKIPTVHANFRMIHQGDKFWFGGGADLTPFYPHVEDFQYFHDTWKEACSPYGNYAQMKKTCDEYFVNPHREDEMRGIGGIFFDHFCSGDIKADFEQVTSLSNFFIESYFPLVRKRLTEKFSDEDVEFQLHRRGRYVEFNLLHDRGTMFGLKTKGKTDSILISLPKRCMYTYKYAPKADGPHDLMLKYYHPKEW